MPTVLPPLRLPTEEGYADSLITVLSDLDTETESQVDVAARFGTESSQARRARTPVPEPRACHLWVAARAGGRA